MVGAREVAVYFLALTGPGLGGAFQSPQLRHHSNYHVAGILRRNNVSRPPPTAGRRCRRPRATTTTTTVVSMVSEREEELKDKIAKLRGAASKGETYERVVGKGSSLTEKMTESKGEFDGSVDRERQVGVRGGG